MRALIVASVVSVVFSGMACADTISYDTVLSNQAYSPTEGVDLSVSSPAFNAALGTLEGVTLTINGSVEDRITGQGDTTPFAATFQNSGLVIGPGLSTSALLSTTMGTATTDLADSRFGVTWSVSTTKDLGAYVGPLLPINSVLYSLDFASLVYNSSGQFVSYSDDRAFFSGDVTETFTYTPVPEPASWGLLGFAAAMLIARRRLRPDLSSSPA